MSNKKRKIRAPFQLHISMLLITLVLLIGGVLTWFNYHQTSQSLHKQANQQIDRITAEVERTLRYTLSPLSTLTRTLARSKITDKSSVRNEGEALAVLNSAIRSSEACTGIQIGFDNGNYLILRKTNSDYLRERFDAPVDAHWMVDRIEHLAGAPQHPQKRRFYDQNMQPITTTLFTQTSFDPRTRPWYQLSMNSAGSTITAPYLFYFIRKAGTTIGAASTDKKAVVAVDVTLDAISELLARQAPTSSSQLVLFNDSGQVVAHPRLQETLRDQGDKIRLTTLSELDNPVLRHVADELHAHPEKLEFRYNQRLWLGTVHKLLISSSDQLYLAVLLPEDELMAEAHAALRWQMTVTFLILAAAIPVAVGFSRAVSQPLAKLTHDAYMISQFKFSHPIDADSSIVEIDRLARSMRKLRETIGQFSHLICSLSAENNFDSLLEQIANEIGNIEQADGVLIYLCDDKVSRWKPMQLQIDGHVAATDDLKEISQKGHALSESIQLNHTDSLVLHDQHAEAESIASLFKLLDCRHIRIFSLPLKDRTGATNGLLCLLYREDQVNKKMQLSEPEQLAFLEVISGFAATSLETRQLLLHQKQLLDSFIKLIAGAIDAKSPYTGGHCQRVPELTKMLAKAASESTDERFADFQLNADEWEALHIASWLHDCGKVTTPEYVVDKATKLQTLYNRIHEIRTRFEVLKRDQEILCWKAIAAGANETDAKRSLQRELQCLDDEYAFVAGCNLGGEDLEPEKQARLKQIARRTWQRTLDDRIGISWEELQRKQRRPSSPLPTNEYLLEDKPEHLVERHDSEKIAENNPWGFKLDPPMHKFNLGELYNLSVKRGTLTQEERYLINDHIVQTIIMLEQLPYPRHLRAVPEIAGGHHERMDGLGYPKRLSQEDMPLTARMMAIADIFEALTASDRPYKAPKKLSEALAIMKKMRDEKHIDADLFELFVNSGIYKQYADKFLDKAQRDEVKVESLLSPAGSFQAEQSPMK